MIAIATRFHFFRSDQASMRLRVGSQANVGITAGAVRGIWMAVFDIFARPRLRTNRASRPNSQRELP